MSIISGPGLKILSGKVNENNEYNIYVPVTNVLNSIVQLLPNPPSGYIWISKNLTAVPAAFGAASTFTIRETAIPANILALGSAAGGPDSTLITAGIQTGVAVEILQTSALAFTLYGSAVLRKVSEFNTLRYTLTAVFTSIFPAIPAGKMLIASTYPYDIGACTGSAISGGQIAWIQNLTALTQTAKWLIKRGGITNMPAVGVGWVVNPSTRSVGSGINGGFPFISLKTGDTVEFRDNAGVGNNAIVGFCYKFVDLIP